MGDETPQIMVNPNRRRQTVYIDDIMTREVVSVTPEAPVLEALETARTGRFRHLPVVRGASVVGVVSDRDLRSVAGLLPSSEALEVMRRTQVAEIMHPDVILAHPLDPIEDAARVMYEHKVGCLPVVSGDDLVGIITETDVLRSFVELSGGLRAGSRIEIDVPDRPGVLAEVGQITRDHRINVASLFTATSSQPGVTTLVVRLEALDLRGVVSDLKAKGFSVRWPDPLKGISR